MQIKKQQLELNMEKQTGSKLGKEYVKAVYCHLGYLNYMWSTSWGNAGLDEAQAESRLLGEISITSDTRCHHSYGRKWRVTKNLLMKVKEKNEKAVLKLKIPKS